MSVVAQMSDGKTFVFGIEEGNVERLKEGKPFVKNLKDFGGPDVTILIIYGKDRDDLARQLSPGIRAETKIVDQTKAGEA